ncbi:hypothetical protein NCCP2495_30080 [Dietzia sp. NCCP-2495]|jgi:hypothetical protein|uniref:hypothetical protein n=1 Tax=Dietzia sp. NCCP-2495 TaxID=2934675 RepID=UPI0022309672|nr:hypothetical protein [Dietzia sp. NCCP-2495]GLB65128.1 hypothetical protein NCCP2495_30080 [Dietzia sp. NCCP-2495]
MNSYNRQQHMSMLARASRVAGRNGRFRERTHYLTAAELRTVPIARLLRETAWADRPDASDQWRDERRQIVADEFARRGFDTAAADIWPRWEPADYDGHALLQEQRRLEAERASAEQATQADPRQEMTVLWATSTLVTAATVTELIDGDEVMERVTTALSQVWEGLETDPAIGGELDMTTGADLAASLANATATATAETSIAPELASTSPEVESDVEL